MRKSLPLLALALFGLTAPAQASDGYRCSLSLVCTKPVSYLPADPSKADPKLPVLREQLCDRAEGELMQFSGMLPISDCSPGNAVMLHVSVQELPMTVLHADKAGCGYSLQLPPDGASSAPSAGLAVLNFAPRPKLTLTTLEFGSFGTMEFERGRLG